MAKRIVWSQRAQDDRKRILKYWINRNKSYAYSKILDRKFREALKIIREFPQIGKLTDDQEARIKIVKDYLLIYEETDKLIILLTIWDSNQDPQKLDEILKF